MTDRLALQELLAAGRPAAHVVAIRGGAALTHAQLLRDVGAWRDAFAAAGAGSRWALYVEDTYEFTAALLGAWQAGCSACLPPDARPATLAALQPHVDGFAGDLPPGVPALRPRAAGAGIESARWRTLDPAAEAVVVWTSGSTGDPVALPKRLSQLADEVEVLGGCWDALVQDARVVGTVAHHHIYGLLFRVLWPLVSGRPLVAERMEQWGDLRQAAGSQRFALVSSPAHLKRIPPDLDATVLANLAAVFSSGGSLPPEALADCRALLHQAPLEVYGSSETGGIAWRRCADPERVDPWHAFPGVELGEDQGLLRVRSSRLPDEEWFTTADEVRMGAAGFELLGRADRIVKVAEKRVSLQAIERALVATGLVHSARALVSRSGVREQLGVVALPTAAGWDVYSRDGRRALNARLQASLEEILDRDVVPRRWRYADEWPVNSLGKTPDALLETLFDPRRPHVRVLERAAASARLSISMPAAAPYFTGHFPEAPILPGVAQVEWAILLGRELFALPPRFLRLEAVKFHRVIPPDTEVTLQLDYSAQDGALAWRITSNEVVASGRAVFGAAS